VFDVIADAGYWTRTCRHGRGEALIARADAGHLTASGYRSKTSRSAVPRERREDIPFLDAVSELRGSGAPAIDQLLLRGEVTATTPAVAMTRSFATRAVDRLYKKNRSATIEPVFADQNTNRGISDASRVEA